MIPCKALRSDIELSGMFNLSAQAILAPSRTSAFAISVSLVINSSSSLKLHQDHMHLLMNGDKKLSL